MKKANKKISDKELRALLADLRQEVAAPPNFRARVLSRLSPQTVMPAGPSLAERLRGYFSRSILVPALASLALLGLAVWFVSAPKSQPQLVATASTRSVVAPASTRSVTRSAPDRPTLALKHSAAPESSAALVMVSASASASLGVGASLAVAPAQMTREGSSLAPSSQVPQFSSGAGGGVPASGATGAAAAASSIGKSDIIVVKPSLTPMVNPLAGNSQVRRNKFRASLGEYAAIFYKVKDQEKIKVEVFDRIGNLVAVLQDSSQSAGTYEIHWFGHDDKGDLLPTGIYLVRVKTEHYDERHKVVFIR